MKGKAHIELGKGKMTKQQKSASSNATEPLQLTIPPFIGQMKAIETNP